MVRCSDGSFYSGATNDLLHRVAQHNAGKGARYTRSRLPVALIYFEKARNRSYALKKEAALKAKTRAEKEALLLALAFKLRKRVAPARQK
ncbi:MAG: GIY-YIG nuclease family protein [Myxococcaceae bacterium]|nr:GIY-YIG nuclease family protein [Myxococcaceae bacterium]